MRFEPPQADFFKKNRKRFMNQMEPNSIAYFRNSDEYLRNGDVHHYYRADSNFYYLTGIDFPDAHLILFPDNPTGEQEILLIPPADPSMEVWTGKRLKPEEATKRSGVEKVEASTKVNPMVFGLQNYCDYCYILVPERGLGLGSSPHLEFIHQIQQRSPGLQFKKAAKILHQMREIKQVEEIEYLKTAIDITHHALIKTWQAMQPGVMEYELEAILTYEIITRKAKRFGYEPIIATGKNAATLHYIDNNTALNQEEMVLYDVGAEYGFYSADISRTIPVGGKFTAEHKEVYNRVLDVQMKIIDEIKPGKTRTEINKKTDELITDHLKAMNYITEDADFRKFYMHRFGHFLGLDVHDVTVNDVLQPGNVLTVEPGIYAEDKGFGIRIEDNILVTPTGCVNLSEAIPKTIEDIEAVF